MTRLATFLEPGKSFSEGIDRLKLAESLGYDSVWVTQVGGREATVTASAYATETSRIKIGTGVLPLYPRTPVVMAQTAATIDEISDGRFILGVGTSHRITIENWHDMELKRPLRAVREYVEAVRAILKGEMYSGEIYKTAFQFMRYEPVRRDLPIYISCLSPRMCTLAGEVADGAVLWMCAPAYIEKVIVPAIHKGREKAGKSMEDFEIVAAVPVSITEDSAEGRNMFRRVGTVYWSLPFYRAAIEGAGYADAIKAFDAGGPSAIPDEAVDDFAGIGDLSAAERAVASYRNAGVTAPAVSGLPHHPGAAGMDDVLKALAPSSS
ncbi:MAG: LLM class flavin-dependent oxidoreductase [Actinobacteria bacterium]|nr:LLM class flavin-dependent oxidoreductase [Actinomycetota bacterium]